jgi:hypothetical protein
MLNIKKIVTAGVALITLVVVSGFSGSVNALHSWGNYHWARQSNPFTLKLGSNLSTSWAPYLVTASNDWSQSDILDTVVVTGTKNPKTCKPTLGQAEICNASYGRNGWLGLAQIWVSGSHITQGVVKMNDTYMSKAPYNTAAEKNHVMCQEVGHIFGLGHQDESGADLGTCMDYSMSTNSQHPNAHDYEQLQQIYSHLDSTNTISSIVNTSAASDSIDLNNSQNWGRRVFRSKSGFVEVYEHTYKDGSKLISLVNLANHQ